MIDSRTVVLSWMLPLQQELNGVVRSYHVNVESTNGIDALRLSTLSSFVSLQSLHPSYTYHFQVAAVTIDVGPFTEFITLKTLEDGMNYIQSIVGMYYTVSVFIVQCHPVLPIMFCGKPLHDQFI